MGLEGVSSGHRSPLVVQARKGTPEFPEVFTQEWKLVVWHLLQIQAPSISPSSPCWRSRAWDATCKRGSEACPASCQESQFRARQVALPGIFRKVRLWLLLVPLQSVNCTHHMEM